MNTRYGASRVVPLAKLKQLPSRGRIRSLTRYVTIAELFQQRLLQAFHSNEICGTEMPFPGVAG